MGRWLSGILSNDSVFGQIMTRCGIIIGANLMFLLFAFPVVTIGPALAALYRVCFRTLRSDGVVNPFKEFWIGFKENAKQGFASWLILLALAVLGILDVRFCMAKGGILTYFRYAIYCLGFAALMITVHLFPVMAAFRDTLPGLVRNALFFIGKNPLRAIALAFLHVFPLVVTWLDIRYQPLYVFLWVTCGFGVIAMTSGSMLLKDFSVYLPPIEDVTDEEGQTQGKNKTGKTLREMRKLGQ